MKRILTTTIIIIASLVTSGVSIAQDIIHTYDSAPIKAKVLEIGDDYMYYKTWDNPDGPLYNMSLSRVLKIVFENGKNLCPCFPIHQSESIRNISIGLQMGTLLRSVWKNTPRRDC